MNEIPFLRDFELDDFTTASSKVTVTTARDNDDGGAQTTQQKKALIPVIPIGATNHQLLCCLHKFDRAKTDMLGPMGQNSSKRSMRSLKTQQMSTTGMAACATTTTPEQQTSSTTSLKNSSNTSSQMTQRPL